MYKCCQLNKNVRVISEWDLKSIEGLVGLYMEVAGIGKSVIDPVSLIGTCSPVNFTETGSSLSMEVYLLLFGIRSTMESSSIKDFASAVISIMSIPFEKEF